MPAFAVVAPALWPGAVPDVTRVTLPAAFELTNWTAQVLPARENARSFTDIAVLIWVAASTFLLLRYLWGWLRLRAAVASARPIPLAGSRVWITLALGPAVVGVFRPRIMIPRWVLSLGQERQRMIVRNEQEHLSAGDHWLLALAPLWAALFPWNLSLWWQLRRLRLSVELDCDARVIRAGVPAHEYGALLLEVAGGRPFVPALVTLSERGIFLERRLRAMSRLEHTNGWARKALLLVPGLVAVLAALLIMVPATRPVLAQRPLAMQQQPDPVFVVDGVLATSGRRIDAVVERIVGIEHLSEAAALARFGEVARGGAILITTSNESSRVQANRPLASMRRPTREVIEAVTVFKNMIDVSVRVREPSSFASFASVVVVNHVILEGTALRQFGSINPKEILRIEVVNGDAALLRFGERAARHGAIVLTVRANYFDGVRLAR